MPRVPRPPFNALIVTLLCFSAIGLFWLKNLGLAASESYLWLLVIGLIFSIVAVVAKFAAGVDFWFEIPVNKTNARATLMFLLGIPFFFLLIMGSAVTGKEFYSPYFFAPLAQFGSDLTGLSFSALSAATSPFWTFFISAITAPVIEELVLGMAFVWMGSLLLGYGLRTLLSLDFGDKNAWWDFAGAMIFSMTMFAVLHFFNRTYFNADGTINASLFTFAALFRLTMNMLIYKFGNFGLMFSISVHMLNNAYILGAAAVLAALGTWPGGVLLMLIMLLIGIYAAVHIKDMWDEGRMAANDFVTFD